MLVASALTAIILLSVFSAHLTSDAVQKQVQSNNKTAAKISAEYVKRELDISLERSALIASLPDMIRAVSQRDEVGVRQLLGVFLASSQHVDRAYVTTPSGKLWSDYPRVPEALGRQLAYLEWFAGVSRHWEPYISDVYRRSIGTHEQVVAIARPIRDSLGQVLGILVYQYALDAIADWLKRVEVGETGRVILVDRAGTVIGAERGLVTEEQFRSLDAFQRAAAGSAWTGEFIWPIDGSRMIGSFEPIAFRNGHPIDSGGIDLLQGSSAESKTWVVIAAQDRASAFAPITRVQTQVGISAVILLVAAVGATLGLVRRNRDIDRLNLDLVRSNQQLERRVEERTAELNTIFDSAPAFIWFKDCANKILRVNKPAAQALGLSPSDLEGRSAYELYPHNAQKYHTDDLDVVQSGQPKLDIVELCPAAGGEMRWMRTDKVPYRDSRGNMIGVVEFSLDITERVRAEEALKELAVQEREARLEAERLGRIKDDFLVTLSHELRTPLVPIIGWIDLLLNSLVDEARQRTALEIIQRNAKAELQLIEDLLDTSRIVSGKLNLELVTVDLAEVVTAAVETVKLAADAKGLSLNVHKDPIWGSSFNPVRGDVKRLQQVVWNLLMNAIKFTDAGGCIDVYLAKRGLWATLRIVDSGIGIPQEFLPHVFERFRQADSSTTRTVGGLGLGLSLVRNLVEAHGGSVTAESAGVGHGAAFTICLPLETASGAANGMVGKGMGRLSVALAAENRLSSGRSDLRPLNGIRVLLAEDTPDEREVLTALLAGQGAEVCATNSANEAFAQSVAWHPHILVSDIGMPGEDGYSLMRRIRSLRGGDRLPAIALTAYGGAEDRRRAAEAGFQLHLAKPTPSDELVRAIAQLARPLAAV